MREYIAYLKDKKTGELIDQTSIDEKNKELAGELFTEYGYELNYEKYTVDLEKSQETIDDTPF